MQLRQQVFPDGVVSRDEAEALIPLSGKVANSDAAWAQCFTEVVCDCMCAGDAADGKLTVNERAPVAELQKLETVAD